ncbi:MAG: hypothetical protein EOO38_04225 [Cytophagaceae bacterium]|jgi:hypothetical protein|nr:MAG: hypothetical protein EOO38_04225 [Cytophagaceae bacterium]
MSGNEELIQSDGLIEIKLWPFALVCYDDERVYMDYFQEDARPFSVDDLRSLKQVVDRMLRELER